MQICCIKFSCLRKFSYFSPQDTILHYIISCLGLILIMLEKLIVIESKLRYFLRVVKNMISLRCVVGF